MPISPRYRDLISLFPQFLPVRRRGWAGLQDVLQSSGLERPHFFLLMALVQETDPGEMLSRQEMESRLFNPYSTIHTFFPTFRTFTQTEYRFFHRAVPKEIRSADGPTQDVRP